MMQIVCNQGKTDCALYDSHSCKLCEINIDGQPSHYLKTMAYTTSTEGTGIINMKDLKKPEQDYVNHPAHYRSNGMEVIDVIEAFELPYHLDNVLKHILRCGRKWDTIEDLKKAEWYLHRYIEKLEKEQANG